MLRTLIFDIETYGGLKGHMTEVATFGYKWEGEGKKATILSGMDFPREFKRDFTNDRPLLEAVSEVWNQADVVVAHYGEKFDRRFLNTRIEHHGLPRLKPVRLIDTWRISKDNFALPGNSLDTLLKFFEAPVQKIDLTYAEWRRVMVADKTALKKLNDHCHNDVLGLEWVYRNHLRQYTNYIANQNLVLEGDHCPCGSKDIIKRGDYLTQTKAMQRYFCKSCRRWPTGPKNGKGIIR